MTTFGVTSQGFLAETFTEIQLDLQGAFKAAFGTSIDVSATSVYGQIIGIMAERLADLWDADAGVYASWTPEGATGLSLDNLCALTGTIRNPATFSSVTSVLSGTNGTVIPQGAITSVGSGGNRFALASPVTIATVPDWQPVHLYAAATLVKSEGNVYFTIAGGTSSDTDDPFDTGTAIVDGTVTWYYIAAGSAAVLGVLQAVDSGALIASSGTLTYIASPIAGWTGTVNPSDATLGAAVETDAALRLRREAQLQQSGSGTVDSIRAHVLALSGVTACSVFDNPGDVTDGNGVPPHAFETLVSGGAYDVAELAHTIWLNKPAGIKSYGANSVDTPDSQGNTQKVAYSTPELKLVYVEVVILADSSVWNTSNVAAKELAIQNELLAYGVSRYTTGKDVVASALEAQCFDVGVLDVTCNIALTASPTVRTTLAMTTRQLAVLDSSRITFSVSYGVP